MFAIKQHISIGLLAAFVFGLLWQTYTMVDFYLNREAITEAYCVNKNKPELDCNGQCHLKKQLETAEAAQDKKTTSSTTAKISLLLLVFSCQADHAYTIELAPVEENYAHLVNPTRGYSAAVFNPPQVL